MTNERDDIYRRLLTERHVFLGSQIDEESVRLAAAQLLLLAAEDRERPIALYVKLGRRIGGRRPRPL